MTAKDNRARLTIRLPRDVSERLDFMADMTERTVNDLVCEAVRDYVTNNRALIGHPPLQEAMDAFLERYAREPRQPRVGRRPRKDEDQE